MLKKRRPNYLIPIAVILGVGAAIVTSSKVWKVYQGEKATADSMKHELSTLQKSQLDHRASDQMMNPVQKEEEARRMGYAKPDEKPLK
ncbi:MAG: hypothetical protein JST51_06060 [Armatimonadetes bacterium]|nr:hypothetical protein [Armatimonadota bacterium]